ncbi:MAG: hypothetical protein D6812_02120 [Deltaproteobacteria bacterium]|nr:MAG: hypothetical protein D6812_02120 [Deltaproteobacteria bacterium]
MDSPSNAPTWTIRLDQLIRLIFPLLLGISGWTFTELRSLSTRVTALETYVIVIREDIAQVKTGIRDIQRALRNGR